MSEAIVIRPEVTLDSVVQRGTDMPHERLEAIQKGLETLHTLELMATTIYKSQITPRQCELNRQLTAAMLNEMSHLQDFQVKLFEYGLKPSKLRWRYWLVGYVFGLGSRILGPRMILRTGIWTEKKAVAHYTKLLAEADWDDDTRKVLERDQADEQRHIDRWRRMLNNPADLC